ncbi:MAG: DUF5615 family PIN-like protein [Planctomycetes bacterium]|nr:DUF5615 family PIN-like protein [Planctomycetota bacterium]
MKLVVDVNLSPAWVDEFQKRGVEAVHWSTIGQKCAPDSEVLRWARANGFVVITHDLDFGTILALTRAAGPSVVQLRSQEILPATTADSVCALLLAYEDAIAAGAILTIDLSSARVRLLPIGGADSGPG